MYRQRLQKEEPHAPAEMSEEHVFGPGVDEPREEESEVELCVSGDFAVPREVEEGVGNKGAG